MLLAAACCHGLAQSAPQAENQSKSNPSSQLPTKSSSGSGGAEQDDQSKLTDGLLDLLSEPEGPKKTSPSLPKTSSPAEMPKSETGQALNRQSSPLVTVQNKMMQAATMMQQGPKLASTVKVQNEIVQQLDDLISQLEQQEKSQQKSSQKSSQQQQKRSQETQSKTDNQSATKNQPNQPTAGDQPGNEKADLAKTGDMTVRTKDPSALQQNVWGHLPSRVRAQMESRMVEEFLPSYRAKIEEYYRSLMEESERK